MSKHFIHSKHSCFSDPAKQTNFWDMAMAQANELANFNIVVEKWDLSKIGGKRGGSKGKQGGAKGYTTARAGTSNTRAAVTDRKYRGCLKVGGQDLPRDSPTN
jgi:hypothetical protein